MESAGFTLWGQEAAPDETAHRNDKAPRRAGSLAGNQQAHKRLGEILVEEGLVSASDLQDAMRQQAASGGPLGAILVSTNRVSPLDVARAVAKQHALPLADLTAAEDGRQGLLSLDPALFRLMPKTFWLDHLVVPLGLRDNRLTVAMAHPRPDGTLQQLADATGYEIRRVVTGYRDVIAALQQIYERTYSEESRHGLLSRQPDDSASVTLVGIQWAILAVSAALAGVGAVYQPLAVLILLNAIAQVFYLGLTFFKLGLLWRLDRTDPGIEIPPEELAQVDRTTLPLYTVLVPAYREAGVLPTLVRALSELNYPSDRLDVKLLLEADDRETIEAAQRLHLPNYIDIVVVPASTPRTKPKACNYGLQLARGEYTVVFDAEDIPEPDQLLKAVIAFRKAPATIACIQAKLAYYNRWQSLITRWFTAEYLMWFDLLLPALHAAQLPIPLGGTSNHFRTAVLRAIGAWDPFNVTEDADLGIRLYKAGYRTAIIDATTYEEAMSHPGGWVRQRSRWIKGYMQTYLVHMRHPVALWRAMGPAGFLSFQVIVGGTPAMLVLNPLYMLLTTLWYLSHEGVLASLLPSWVYLVAAMNLFLGNFAFTFLNMAAVARRNLWDLVAWTALSPLYWVLMSIAAWRSLMQLILRPSYWEKTEHGLAMLPGSQGSAELGAAS